MHGEILRLAWPVFIGQLAVMANGVIDTVMAGRLSPADMAAVGLGASIYITVYVGLMGVLLALSPIAAHHYGAGRLDDIGAAFRHALWLALAIAVPGSLALEACVQLVRWLTLASSDFRLSCVPEGIEGFRLSRAAGAGGALLLSARVKVRRDDALDLECRMVDDLRGDADGGALGVALVPVPGAHAADDMRTMWREIHGQTRGA